jgi:hypothetical protein
MTFFGMACVPGRFAGPPGAAGRNHRVKLTFSVRIREVFMSDANPGAATSWNFASVLE